MSDTNESHDLENPIKNSELTQSNSLEHKLKVDETKSSEKEEFNEIKAAQKEAVVENEGEILTEALLNEAEIDAESVVKSSIQTSTEAEIETKNLSSEEVSDENKNTISLSSETSIPTTDDTLEKKVPSAINDETKGEASNKALETENVTSVTDGNSDESQEESTNDEEEIESSEDEENEDDTDEKDYSSLSEKQLIDELDSLLKNKKIQDIKNEVEEIKTEFNAKFAEELEAKKEEFLAEGGNIIDFQYSTPHKKEFNSLYFEFKERRNAHFKSLKRDLKANLDKRLELIELLKGLWNTEENINTTYNHFKDIQEQWRTAGAIPRDAYNLVWNNYHHHVENFYDYLHLNREFRDLDFKHNLEQKLKLIGRAEELTQETDINKAFRELQMLHKMWKEETGPVAKEHRDEVWDKFSDATKLIHDKRHAIQQNEEAKYEGNYEKKQQIIAQIEEISKNTKASHNAWQTAMKNVQALRDEYFKTGRVPRANNKEIWKDFKEATGTFNKSKNNFYKDQKKEQYANLEKKQELIKLADENKDNEDTEVATQLFKKIQADWKKIGHVPRKDSDKLWKQFKKACNHYFERLNAQKNEANKEELEHLESKQKMLDALAAFELTGSHKDDLVSIKKYIADWKEIGRVPYKDRQITQKFNNALDDLFKKLDLGKKETELIKFENKLDTMVNQEDERKLRNEHFFISKKIDETKDEIRQLENNLGFFHHVKEDNPLVKEVHKNIAKHKEQLEVWQAKLGKIKMARD